MTYYYKADYYVMPEYRYSFFSIWYLWDVLLNYIIWAKKGNAFFGSINKLVQSRKK